MKNIILFLLLFFLSVSTWADEYYIGQWQWDDTSQEKFWRPPIPEKNTGTIDLRTNAQAAIAGGTPEGYALFAYSELVTHADLTYLGGDLDAKPNERTLGAVRTKLGITPNKESIREIVYELLTDHSDPTGKDRWKPLRPGVDGNNKVYFGSAGIIKQVKITPFVSPEWEKIQLAVQEDYRQMLQAADHRLLAKWLDYQEDKYGVKYQHFIPLDAVFIASLPHATTNTESFDCADSGSIDCDLDWTQTTGDLDIVSNIAVNQTASGFRGLPLSNPLSGSDHYTEADVNLGGTGGSDEKNAGLLLRSDNDTPTEDEYNCRPTDFSVFNLKIFKVVGGSFTQLYNQSHTEPSKPFNFRCEANGSTLKILINSTEEVEITDSAITSGNLTGYRGFDGATSGGLTSRYNNYESADFAVGGDTSVGTILYGDINVHGGIKIY